MRAKIERTAVSVLYRESHRNDSVLQRFYKTDIDFSKR